MKQNELKPPLGAKRSGKRVGRGDGSGGGTYSGRGCKGQKARSGGGVRIGFEGGQLPIIKRLPRKRGFTNIFRTEYSVISVGKLNRFAPNATVTPQDLVGAGLIKSLKQPVKILGDGELAHPLLVKAHKFSDTAEKKIVAVGGKAERI